MRPGLTFSHCFSASLLLAGITILAFLDTRNDFWQLFTGFGIASLGWLIALMISWQEKKIFWAIGVGVLARVILIPSVPYLSDDWYRFVWDGMMSLDGQHPFLTVPSDFGAEQLKAFEGINSADYYSVYPPALQWIFAASAKIVPHSFIPFRIVILLFEIGSIFLIYKLLPSGKKAYVAVYALCPLAIVEMVGGIHFEAGMLFFILLAAWFYKKENWIAGGVFLGGAIAVKLIPVILLPLLPFFLGWRKGVFSGLIAATVAIMTFLPYGIVQTWEHMSQSMQLYYQNFEFNACLYYVVREITTSVSGYNQIAVVGPVMAAVSGLFILIIVAVRRPKNVDQFLATSVLVLSVYHLFATTVHPWYIVPLVGLSVFGRFRFVLVWSFMIFLTYMAYNGGKFHEPIGLVLAEYILVLAILRLEFIRATPLGRKILAWWAIKRARIKFKRLNVWLNEPRPKSLLEIGVGSGGLMKLFKDDGYEVSGVDVEKKSCFDDIEPLIYDGKKLPFSNSSIDTVMIITVLHHTDNPETVLKEAIRVAARRIIIMEDVYSSQLQKQLTYQLDGLINDEWMVHPHSNKRELEWENLFEFEGLTVNRKRADKVFSYFKQTTWDLNLRPQNA